MTNTNEPTTSVTPVSQWKKGASAGTLHEVRLPSGNVALLRRVGMETFLKLGVIPNSLASVIQRQISKAQKGEEVADKDIEEEMMKLLEDPTKLSDIMELADGVLLVCCADPKVNKTPGPGEPRSEDLLYVDEIDLEDKMFIFSWAVGGEDAATDAKPFRGEPTADVASVQPSEGLVSETQPIGGYTGPYPGLRI